MKSAFVKPSVGDRLLMVPTGTRQLRNPDHRYSTVEVTKVGRVWGTCVTLHDGKPSVFGHQFALDSGSEKSGNYNPSWRLVTQEQLDAEERREELLAALKDAGLERSYYSKNTDWMTNEALEELLQVIKRQMVLAE